MAQSLIGSSDWYRKQWDQLSTLEKKPWLIMWGTEDEFITPDFLDKWKKRLPEAEIHLFKCGHFVQEEQTEAAIAVLRNVLKY